MQAIPFIPEEKAASILGIAAATLKKKRLYHSEKGALWNELKSYKINGAIFYDAHNVVAFKDALDKASSVKKRRGPKK